MITIDPTAIEKITDLYIDENDPSILGLRVFVEGGGCSGFQYGFTWDWIKNEDDFNFNISDRINILVDAMSMQYLQGAVIKFETSLMNSSFIISNPNATSKCGCGSSFSA